MKLSEALILGECAVPPHHNNWYVWNRNEVCGACAVGRMCLAAGYIPVQNENVGSYEEARHIGQFMAKQWPWTVMFKSDKHFDHANTVLAEISYRYEDLRMSMKEIADWVATIEPQEAPARLWDFAGPGVLALLVYLITVVWG